MAKREKCKVCGKIIKDDLESMYCGHGAVRVYDNEGKLKYCLCAIHATFVTNNDRKSSMWIEQDYDFKLVKCKTCGDMFYQNARNQKHCDSCREEIYASTRNGYSRIGEKGKGKKGTERVREIQAK